MPAGRPTKYSDEILEKANAYVNGGFASEGDVVPSVAGLSCSLDVARVTLHDWAETYPEFSYTLTKCKGVQERMLLSGGLSSTMNSTITKLMLANHGYSDKVEQDVTSNGQTVAPLAINIIGIDPDDGDSD